MRFPPIQASTVGTPPYAPVAARIRPKYLRPYGAGVMLITNPTSEMSWLMRTKRNRVLALSERIAQVITQEQATTYTGIVRSWI